MAAIGSEFQTFGKEKLMLWTVGVVALILWTMGLVAGFTLGGFIHLLPVLAVAAVFLQIISGRRINDY